MKARFRQIACAVVAATLAVACTGQFPVGLSERQAAAEAFDEDVLIAGLAYAEAWHRRERTGIADALQPGLDVETIRHKLENVGLSATREAQLLWGWRDGEEGAAPFLWYHDFLSLDQALRQRRLLISTPLLRWDPDYLPFLSFDGEWFALDCGADVTDAGPIVHFFIEDEPRLTFTNLTTFVATMRESIETGALRWDAELEGMVDDIAALDAIHRRRNPGLAFPYFVPTDPIASQIP